MNNIIKLANIQLSKSPDDVIKIAGLLRFLKNKIRSMFDSEMAQDAAKLVTTTANIKPFLSQTYKSIAKIESAIDDLDIDSYKANVEELKINIAQLNDKIKDLDQFMLDSDQETQISGDVSETPSNTNEPVVENRSSNSFVNLLKYPRERAKVPDDIETYKGIQTLSQLGVTADDIRVNEGNMRAMFASWALVVNKSSAEAGEELLKEQEQVTFDNFKKSIYDKIPEMRIEKILGRELTVIDDPKYGQKGTKKPGLLEVRVVSDVLQLNPPVDNWKLKVVCILIDKRENKEAPLKFSLYRQLVLAAYNQNTEKTYVGEANE